jgi:transposase
MPKARLQKKVDDANDLMIAAEAELSVTLRALTVSPRAEKTTVSRRVEDALARLRAARQTLHEIRGILEEQGQNDQKEEEKEDSSG